MMRITLPTLAVLLAAILSLTACSTTASFSGQAVRASSKPETTRSPASEPTFDIDALPAASWQSVIPSLVPYSASVLPTVTMSYTLSADAPLYPTATATLPVALLTQNSVLGGRTVVTPLASEKSRSLVLTPSRISLPSAGPAPAQSSSWIETALLVPANPLIAHVRVDLAAQTVSIVTSASQAIRSSGKAAIGAPATSTPVGIFQIEGFYSDAAAPAEGRIALLSAHSTENDEPFDNPGGMIGIHRFISAQRSGAVSHGCVRVDQTLLDAIDALPIGTLVQIG